MRSRWGVSQERVAGNRFTSRYKRYPLERFRSASEVDHCPWSGTPKRSEHPSHRASTTLSCDGHPQRFLRVSFANSDYSAQVHEIRPCTTGEYQLRLKDGREYTVTRTYRKNLKSLAEFWIGTGTSLAE